MAGTWVKLEQKETGPGARSSHAITIVGNKVYAFGGEFTPRVPVDNNMYMFDLNITTWSVVDTVGDIPPPRVGVTMVSIGDTIFMFGGRDQEHKELDEFYSFNTSTNRWALLSSADAGPPCQSYHSMVADDKWVYVFGGCGDKGDRLNDLWVYNVAEGRWARMIQSGEACRPRGGTGLAIARGKVWVVYGFSGVEPDDVHCYDPSSDKWTLVETVGKKPTPRSVFSTAGVGKYVVIFGGEIDPSDLGHLGAGKFSAEAFALDTETRTWTKLGDDVSHVADSDHPGPRGWCAFSARALDGRPGLLVYGGNSATNDRLDDMYFFTPNLEPTS